MLDQPERRDPGRDNQRRRAEFDKRQTAEMLASVMQISSATDRRIDQLRNVARLVRLRQRGC